MAQLAQDPQQAQAQQPMQDQAPQEGTEGVQPGEFEDTPMEELVTGIHEGMVQLLKNVEGQASAGQKRAIADALQSYRSAIASLGGGEVPPQERGGNTTMEQGGAETIPV
jgi:hypothetical protein